MLATDAADMIRKRPIFLTWDLLVTWINRTMIDGWVSNVNRISRTKTPMTCIDKECWLPVEDTGWSHLQGMTSHKIWKTLRVLLQDVVGEYLHWRLKTVARKTTETIFQSVRIFLSFEKKERKKINVFRGANSQKSLIRVHNKQSLTKMI